MDDCTTHEGRLVVFISVQNLVGIDALISLHWLRVPERIVFKVVTLTFHALHGTAPPYNT